MKPREYWVNDNAEGDGTFTVSRTEWFGYIPVIEKSAFDRLQKAFLMARDMLDEIHEADSYMVDELWIEKIDRMAALCPDESSYEL